MAGAYPALAAYHHGEMLALCNASCQRSDGPAAAPMRAFGEHLSGSFIRSHRAVLARARKLFDFLERIKASSHVEVRQRCPGAALPTCAVQQRAPTRFG